MTQKAVSATGSDSEQLDESDWGVGMTVIIYMGRELQGSVQYVGEFVSCLLDVESFQLANVCWTLILRFQS